MKNTLSALVLLAFALVNGMKAQDQANLLGTWSDSELVGSNFYNNIYNEIWGLSVNGREFAVIGSTAGTHIIDVTDPAAAEEVVFVPGAAQGGAIIHRDYHDYNGYLYAVSDESSSTLQIIDITGLPDTAEVVYDENTLIRRAHNIFIDSSAAILYAFATNSPLGGSFAMRMYDLSNPEAPAFIAQYREFDDITAGHVHDGYVRDGIAFLHCGGSGFAIVDFSDPLSPRTISTMPTYPQQGYNHSGWLSDDGKTYYMADENHGLDMKIVDVENPCEISVTGTFNAGVSNPTSIPHNQIVACNYLYSSYYYDGLQVFDLSDPSNPQKVLYYDTYDQADAASFKGAWGVYPFLPSGHILLSDMQSGLFIFDGIGVPCGPNPEKEPVNEACAVVSATYDREWTDRLTLYPQPAGAGSTIYVEGMQAFGDPLEVALFSAAGVKVQTSGFSYNGDRMTMETPAGLPAGWYVLQIIGRDSGPASLPLQLLGR